MTTELIWQTCMLSTGASRIHSWLFPVVMSELENVWVLSLRYVSSTLQRHRLRLWRSGTLKTTTADYYECKTSELQLQVLQWDFLSVSHGNTHKHGIITHTSVALWAVNVQRLGRVRLPQFSSLFLSFFPWNGSNRGTVSERTQTAGGQTLIWSEKSYWPPLTKITFTFVYVTARGKKDHTSL